VIELPESLLEPSSNSRMSKKPWFSSKSWETSWLKEINPKLFCSSTTNKIILSYLCSPWDSTSLKTKVRNSSRTNYSKISEKSIPMLSKWISTKFLQQLLLHWMEPILAEFILRIKKKENYSLLNILLRDKTFSKTIRLESTLPSISMLIPRLWKRSR